MSPELISNLSSYLRWKLVQLGLDDHYKRLNEVRGKDRVGHSQVGGLS